MLFLKQTESRRVIIETIHSAAFAEKKVSAAYNISAEP